uniref:Uncharacterized protein n=1 Tax=Myotis myotis TaxID=51298 RepID=A0A7J7U5M1_MYOMY|nr:hypothetical protein mMyoMyo1_008883 [Myotis myotis]
MELAARLPRGLWPSCCACAGPTRGLHAAHVPGLHVTFTLRMRRAYTARTDGSLPPSWACGPPGAAPRSSRKSKLCLLTVQRHCFHGVVFLPPPRCPLNLVASASEERPGLCRLWRDAPGSPPSSSPPNGPLSPGVRGSGRVCPAASGQRSALRAWPGPGLPAERRRHTVRVQALSGRNSFLPSRLMVVILQYTRTNSFLPFGILKRSRSPLQHVRWREGKGTPFCLSSSASTVSWRPPSGARGGLLSVPWAVTAAARFNSAAAA